MHTFPEYDKHIKPHQQHDVKTLIFHDIRVLNLNLEMLLNGKTIYTVEPLYNEVLGTMKITLLYQLSHYIRVKTKNLNRRDQQTYLVITGFCYILPLYNEVPLYYFTFLF